MERNKFVNILKELQRDGIEVAILTLTENGQSDYLRRQGVVRKDCTWIIIMFMCYGQILRLVWQYQYPWLSDGRRQYYKN